MDLLKKFESNQVSTLSEGKNIPSFKAGDTVKVNYRIVEGNKERVQPYQGVCIARKNDGINSAFTVRKVSNGEGIERVFPLYSPKIESIELVRRGVVRRSKLYYMRELSGKAARIKEKMEFDSKKTSKKNSSDLKPTDKAAIKSEAQNSEAQKPKENKE